MRGSILLLLLIGVEGAPSKDVQDLCRDEARSTTTVREDVIVAIRGGGFRRRPGQAMIHPCCPSDDDARRVFMSVLTFINKLKTYGFGDTRVLGTTYGCPAGDAQYTKELQEWYEPYLKSSEDWTMLSHGSKAHDKHRQKSGAQGLWTQSKFVVSELQARLRPVEAAAPPKLLVELRADQCINQTVAALRFGLLPLVSANAADSLVDLLTGADEMVAVRNWTLFRECLDEGPAGDVVPGPYARCYTHWDDLPDAPSVIPAMRELFKLGPERTACAENIVRRQVRGSCVADDAFPNHAWLHRAPAKD